MCDLLYVLPKPDFFTEGGRGRVTHALGISEGFLEHNWKVAILSGPGASDHWFCPDGISEVTVGQRGRSRRVGSAGELLWLMKLHSVFLRQIRRHRPRLVILRYRFRWIGWAAWAARALRRAGIPSVLEVNSLGYHMTAQYLPEYARKALLRLELAVVARFDLIYVVSPQLKTLLARSLNDTRIAVVRNGVTARFLGNVCTEPGKDTERNVVAEGKRCVYFGSLHRYYDFAIVLAAFQRILSQFPSLELHFHGAGPALEALRSENENVPNVYFYGTYEICDIVKWLNKAKDIIILPPKRAHDIPLSGGLSTKLFEYMMMGLPILAAKQVEEILTHEENALLYDPTSAEDLARQMTRIVSDPDLARRLAVNAQRAARDKHTWRSRCRSLIEAISEIVPEREKPRNDTPVNATGRVADTECRSGPEPGGLGGS